MRRSLLGISLTILAGLALWIGIWGSLLVLHGQRLNRLQGEVDEHLRQRDFSSLALMPAQLRKRMADMRRDLRMLGLVTWVPGIAAERDSAFTLLDKLDVLRSVGTRADAVVEEAQSRLAGVSTLNVIAPETWNAIREIVLGHGSDMRTLAAQADAVLGKSVGSRIERVRDAHADLDRILRIVRRGASAWAEDGASLLDLAGIDHERTFLMLYQNADELRPGGGLISVYGLVGMRNGAVTSLTVKHVNVIYGKGPTPPVAAPAPLSQYVFPTKNLPNINWHPEPRTWLAEALDMWEIIGGEPVDGVIALGTPLLKDLVGLYGPIKLPGIEKELTAENVVAEIDAVTIAEFDRLSNIPNSYDILAPLVNTLWERMRATTPEHALPLLQVIQRNVQARNLFLVVRDPTVQRALEHAGLDARMPAPHGDELYVLDSNLASAKDDAVLKRSLEHRVDLRDPGAPTARARVQYDFTNGRPDHRTWPYRGYLRFLVPIGSTVKDVTETQSLLEASEEAGRTSFGSYVFLSFGGSQTTGIQYALPQSVSDMAKNGQYTLTLRKQGGLEMPFEVTVELPSGWKNGKRTATLGEIVQESATTVRWKGRLTKDGVLTVEK